jgi:small-conductance mechanosensitive channel
MTHAINLWLAEIGWTARGEQLAVAAALVAVAALTGELAARFGGPACMSWVQSRFGVRGALSSKHVPELLRFGAGALILAFPLTILPFDGPALMVLSTGFSAALAMTVSTVLRIGGMPLWTCIILAIATFALTMAGALGGVGPLTASLDATALHVGMRRISLLTVVNFLIVAAVLFTATRVANHLVTHAVGRLSALDLSQRALIQKLGSLAVVLVALLFGVDILGIDLTTLTVFSGAFGLAVGFGLQKTFGNLIAGLILLMDKSVKPGDVVAVGDTFGAINKIGIRAVSVITRDGKEHLIPNEQLMTQPVENWSFSSRDVRIHIPVVIAYDSDLKLAQKLMIQAAKASRRVLPNPEPSVWLLAYGERGLEHDIMVWIIDPEQGVGNVQSDILNRLWELFRANGIGLPYPQRDVHLHGEPLHKPGGANLPPTEKTA